MLDFTVPANATKIYDHLAAASKSLSTYLTDPLWQTVDGPYTLTAFDATSGAFTLTPNTTYGGPHARTMSALQAIPFTSPEAEFDAVRAGAVDVGFTPLIDITRAGAVKAGGYNVFGYPDFGFNYVVYNFLDKTGHFNSIICAVVHPAGDRAPAGPGRLHQGVFRRRGRPGLRPGTGAAGQPLRSRGRGHRPVSVQHPGRYRTAEEPRLDRAPR